MSALVIRRAPAFSNIRPTYLVRAFYASTRTPGQHSSLALKSDVKAREEESGKHIVGDTGKGVEGPHYEDLSGPSITAPLTGAWTLMNPIYTTADYWRLPADAKIYDVIRAVRADEATHRFVNHTLADLDQKTDFNPFALGEAPAEIKWTKPGFSREESAVFARNAQQALMKRVNAVEQKTIGR
ncbi:hypothetical protein P7C73_g3904, partial [Tremellales sp. Uapishka_1]